LRKTIRKRMTIQIREKLRINSLEDEMEYSNIRWYRHIKRTDIERLPRETIEYKLNRNWPRRIPRYKCDERIKKIETEE